MIWSFSSSKMFSRCQRQWYFNNVVAHHQSKNNPIRREAFILSKLDSIWSWRGKLVDQVISKYIVPLLNKGENINIENAISYAKHLFIKQLSFGKENRLRTPNLVISKVQEEFAAFRDIEYGLGLPQEDIDKSWEDIETSLSNFFSMSNLMKLLKNADYLVPQRSLQYNIDIPNYPSIHVKAFPDLIIFSQANPPIIIDWKVKQLSPVDYRLQLAIYAKALEKCSPHRDYRKFILDCSETDIQLIEIQLLIGSQRHYTLNQSDFDDIDSYIMESVLKMHLAVSDLSKKQFKPLEIPATNYPDVCGECSFKSICWEESTCQE